MLTSQQLYAFNKFKELKIGALFMKQGTGKTRVALELIKTTTSDLVIFFCPCSTKENLRTEIEKWGLDKEYLIIGYETISLSSRTYLEVLEIAKQSKQLFIVADESVFIKNDSSKRYTRLKEIAKYSEYRLILNGTPVTKNEWDIYNQMNFLSPKIINMGKDEFLNVFFKKIKYKKKGCKENIIYKLSDVNIDYLHKLIENYIFECDFTFDKEIKENYIEISASMTTLDDYNEIKNKFLEDLANNQATVVSFVNLANTCFGDIERHHKIAKYLKDKGQIIVFCTLLKEVENISNNLDSYVITGATPLVERQDIIEKFKNDTKPLIMTLGVGAFGLNLQFCNKIAFSSITFDYAKVEQSMSRIKRIGQEKDIEYTYFKSNLGIYNMIFDNLSKKEDLNDLLIKFIEKGVENLEKIL